MIFTRCRMIISYSHNFLFVHVPKTGGSSVTEALRPCAHLTQDCWMNRLLAWVGIHVNHYAPYRQKLFRLHTTAAEFQRELPRDVFRGLFKFAFVRNPWDAMVSYYHFMVTNPRHHRHQWAKNSGGFEAWLESETRRRKRTPQLGRITDKQGQVLVDVVGRYETLNDDFARICQRLGLSATLPHTNRSGHRDYRTYYTDRGIELVANACRVDIEFFGYKFEAPRTG